MVEGCKGKIHRRIFRLTTPPAGLWGLGGMEVIMISDNELFLRRLEFVRKQSGGEWGDDIERADAAKLEAFVRQIAKEVVA